MRYRAILTVVVALTALTARGQFLGDALAAAGFAETEEEAAAGLAALAMSGRTPREIMGSEPKSSANVYDPRSSANISTPRESATGSAPPPSSNISSPQMSQNVSRPDASTNILYPPSSLNPPPASTEAPTAGEAMTAPSGSVAPYRPPGAGSSFAGSGKYYTPEEVTEWKMGFAPVGMKFDRPPADSEDVTGSWGTYKYAKGVFYKPEGSKWVVVPAPVGARVKDRPAAGSGILYKNVAYTYYNGAFYVWNREANAADVVAPPMGATVTYIPDSAVKQDRDGKPCYMYGGTCFRPGFRGSTVVYTVA